MKKTLVAAVAVMAGSLLLVQPATASGGRGHGHGHWHGGPRASFGLYFGGPAYGPWYDPWYRPFPPPAYYEPRTVIIERDPPVYVQREPAPPAQVQAPAANPIWYYCPNPAGYYPHVPRCNQQWVPVDPSTVPPR